MRSKQDFLNLGLSVRSLERKLTDAGLSITAFDQNLSPQQELIIDNLYDLIKKEHDFTVSDGEQIKVSYDRVGLESVKLNHAISQLGSEYLILLDSCSLMCKRSTKFLLSLETALIKYKKKVTVVGWVYHELERVRGKLAKDEPKKSELAKRNLDILYRMFENGYVYKNIEKNKSEFFSYGLADLEIFELFDRASNHYKKYKDVLIITQDKNLQQDLMLRFMRKSVLPLGKEREVLKQKSTICRVYDDNKGEEVYKEVVFCDNYNLTISDIRLKKQLKENFFTFSNLVLSEKFLQNEKVSFKLDQEK